MALPELISNATSPESLSAWGLKTTPVDNPPGMMTSRLDLVTGGLFGSGGVGSCTELIPRCRCSKPIRLRHLGLRPYPMHWPAVGPESVRRPVGRRRDSF
jgi:hypothetical protein